MRRNSIASTSIGGQKNAGEWRPRRRLGVCEGEAHALMLEEMLKGANVVISGDAGKRMLFSRSLRLLQLVSSMGVYKSERFDSGRERLPRPIIS